MRKLSVNVDHVATLRRARRESFPDPVPAALLAELGGADSITVHLRRDRRHITERDVELLRATLQTELNLEMACTAEMQAVALRLRPAQITLVPESANELTTEGGLDLAGRLRHLIPAVRRFRRAGLQVSAFIEADPRQINAAVQLGCGIVEINTEPYRRLTASRLPARPTGALDRELVRIRSSVEQAAAAGLTVHAGHGLDYRNLRPLLGIDGLSGFSIGFAIVARAVFVGLREATAEMKRLMEVNT
jgi:pyridoxine 5-phosphate synthase